MIVSLPQAPVDPDHQRPVGWLATITTRDHSHDLDVRHRGDGIQRGYELSAITRVGLRRQRIDWQAAALAARCTTPPAQSVGLQACEIASCRKGAECEQHPEPATVATRRERRGKDHAGVENDGPHMRHSKGDYSPIAAWMSSSVSPALRSSSARISSSSR